MIPVMQTRFGGPKAPPVLQGNCFQACVASLFELPLDQAFDATVHTAEDWFDHFIVWCKARGLFPVYFDQASINHWDKYYPDGYMIVESMLGDIPHVVISKDTASNAVHCPVRGSVSGLEPGEEPHGAFMFAKVHW